MHRILVIDDNEAIHGDFRKILSEGSPEGSSKLATAKMAVFGRSAAPAPARVRFELDSALQGQEGLARVEEAVNQKRHYCIAFVDMRMPPGWDGLQTIQRLWNVDPDLQIVICSAYSDHSWEEITEKLGLTDRLLILKKPFDPVEVAQLATALSAKWVLKQQATLKMDELERLAQQRAGDLAHAALHDKLTGLPNRALLKDRIAQAIEWHKRNPEHGFALYFLDFDRFKLINDSLGHEAGDELLVEIANRLRLCLRTTDSVARPSESNLAARIGGDEFVVLADGVRDPTSAARIAERMLAKLAAPYELKGHRLTSTASIGVTTSDLAYRTPEDALRDADTAMYHAKAAGKARYVMFDRKMHEEVVTRLHLENQLRGVVDRQELVLFYQPIVCLTDGALKGFEALVRWRHPDRGIVPPVEFIPCAEETGLIVPIGWWVLEESCRQLRTWKDKYACLPNLSMSVNVSARQLTAPDFAQRVGQILQACRVAPDSIILEVTEGVVIKDPQAAAQVFDQLHAVGVQLHMDDFGTGYSSLSYLRRFRLDGLKIDRSFIQNADEQRDYAAIVHAVANLARSLRMTLTAEGIETAEQVTLLQAMDCEHAQGYFFARPQPAEAAEEFIAGKILARSAA